jgi:putative ABC transport system permease protein
VAETLRDGGRTVVSTRGGGWLGAGLVVAQVALAVCLVVGAGLVLGGVDRAVNGALGFDKRQVITAEMRLDGPAYSDPEPRRQFVARVLDRLRGIPAVEGLSAASSLPYSPGGGQLSRTIYPEGVELAEAEVRSARLLRVTPAYFDVLRIPLLEGRGLTDADRPETPAVAVVGRAFADRYWPGESPIGKRFRTTRDGQWLEVVGVAGDIVNDLLLNRGWPAYYTPLAQEPTFATAFAIRTAVDPLAVAGELRRAIAAVDPDLPVLQLRSMEQVVAERAGGITHLARLLGVMSGVALALALMGIYSLMAYAASRRTQEFGVRMALGATRGEVIRLSLRHAVVITGLGLAAGAACAAALNRVMSSTLFGLVSFDITAIVAMTLGIGATALVAGWLPARRAADLDPSVALRTE